MAYIKVISGIQVVIPKKEMYVLSLKTFPTDNPKEVQVKSSIPLIIQALGPSVIPRLQFRENGDVAADFTREEVQKVFKQLEKNNPECLHIETSGPKPRMRLDNPPPAYKKRKAKKKNVSSHH